MKQKTDDYTSVIANSTFEVNKG